jgi:hypothetical protein
MTNAEYTKHLRKAAKAINIALRLKRISEREYERRYGVNPSDVDDDCFIDTTGAIGECREDITWKHVDDGAHNYVGLPRYQESSVLSEPKNQDK